MSKKRIVQLITVLAVAVAAILIVCPYHAIADEGLSDEPIVAESVEQAESVVVSDDPAVLDEASGTDDLGQEVAILEPSDDAGATESNAALQDEVLPVPSEDGEADYPAEPVEEAEPAPLGAGADSAEPLGAVVYKGTCGTAPWSIDSNGLLTIGPGELDSYDFPWLEYAKKIKSVVVKKGTVASYSCSGMFDGCTKLVSADLTGLDVSGAEDMSWMFDDCSKLSTLKLTGWDVSSVWDMCGMFRNCSSLKSINISGWDVSSVQNMSSMFSGCSSLSSFKPTGWDVSSVQNMSQMFYECSKLSSIGISKWDVSSVTEMYSMFSGCSSLKSIDLSGWDVSTVRELGSMFSGCSALSALNLSRWDVSAVRSMGYLFENCSSLTSLDLSGWDTSAATGKYAMAGMFGYCEKLAKIKVGKRFNVSKAFPDAIAGNGGWQSSGSWWSSKDKAWYSVAQIKSKRKGIADTYYTAPPLSEVKLIPIYRMYNVRTSEHLWTKSKAEYDSCGRGAYKDWRKENVAWYSPNIPAPTDYYEPKMSTLGNYVYVWRLYDQYETGDHIYLTYGSEMDMYLSYGWQVDKGAGFWTLKKGNTIPKKTTIPIYRAYNSRLYRGKHHYTPSKVEYDSICKHNGWKPEGTKFYVVKK